MTRRLLLGCSAVGNALVEHTRDERGARDDLVAVTDDTGWVSTLRDRNVATVEADPTDPATYPDSAAVVLVASDDAARNVAAARAARSTYPDAMIVAHLGTAPTDEQRAAVAAALANGVGPPGAGGAAAPGGGGGAGAGAGAGRAPAVRGGGARAAAARGRGAAGRWAAASSRGAAGGCASATTGRTSSRTPSPGSRTRARRWCWSARRTSSRA